MFPVSFPGAIIRRHTGTPVMGYSGASWLIQEVCNALFDALFSILPLATDMDQVEATPVAAPRRTSLGAGSEGGARSRHRARAGAVRISAAKRLRDAAEPKPAPAAAKWSNRKMWIWQARRSGAGGPHRTPGLFRQTRRVR
jgi:chlorophyllide a reductase subunit Z